MNNQSLFLLYESFNLNKMKIEDAIIGLVGGVDNYFDIYNEIFIFGITNLIMLNSTLHFDFLVFMGLN